jgi:hypothetical protein
MEKLFNVFVLLAMILCSIIAINCKGFCKILFVVPIIGAIWFVSYFQYRLEQKEKDQKTYFINKYKK